MGLMDSLMTSIPANEFSDRLDRTLHWKPIEKML
jgi:hypothetical protein